MVIEIEEELDTDMWTLYVDRIINLYSNGVGIVLISQPKKYYLMAIQLQFEYTNNKMEYKACIHGLEATLERKVEKLDVHGNSLLIIY